MHLSGFCVDAVVERNHPVMFFNNLGVSMQLPSILHVEGALL